MQSVRKNFFLTPVLCPKTMDSCKPLWSGWLLRLCFLCIIAVNQSVYGPVLAQDAPRDAYSAQTLARIRFVLNRLEQLQIKPGEDPVFLPGSYPSFIHHRPHFKKKKKDITIFYNILIDLTLKKLRPALPDSLQIRIDTLLQRSARIYPRFYNESRGSYNFWLRDSAYRFPYSWWIPLIKKDGAVPDDMDDTVLSRFVDPKGNKDSLEKLHQLLQDFTLEPGNHLHTAPKAYKKYYTYSTWFGKKFPVVLDAVVLSNILSFVCHYELPWTKADSAALNLIVHTIQSADFIRRPLAISPYYGKTSILLYHYSRLMQQKDLPPLDSLRPRLIKAGRSILQNPATDMMEKVITTNALLQLGEKPSLLELPAGQNWQSVIEHSDFAYFIGNIPSYMPRGLQATLHPLHALMYYHYCPAFNDVLVLQYLVTASAKQGSPYALETDPSK